MRLASPGVNVDSDNANFGPGNVNDGNANSGNNLFNSNGNWNANELGVRPCSFYKLWLYNESYVRDNIETNHSPLTRNCYK